MLLNVSEASIQKPWNFQMWKWFDYLFMLSDHFCTTSYVTIHVMFGFKLKPMSRLNRTTEHFHFVTFHAVECNFRKFRKHGHFWFQILSSHGTRHQMVFSRNIWIAQKSWLRRWHPQKIMTSKIRGYMPNSALHSNRIIIFCEQTGVQ